MDRKDRERELVSAALPDLVPRVISGGNTAVGLQGCHGLAGVVLCVISGAQH